MVLTFNTGLGSVFVGNNRIIIIFFLALEEKHMKKSLILLLTLILFMGLTVVVSGCEEDSDDDDDSSGGDDEIDEAYEEYGCADGGDDACGQAICAMIEGYDQSMTAYEDAGISEDIVGDVMNCFSDYIGCFQAACPSVEEMDSNAMMECSTSYQTCATNAVGY